MEIEKQNIEAIKRRKAPKLAQNHAKAANKIPLYKAKIPVGKTTTRGRYSSVLKSVGVKIDINATPIISSVLSFWRSSCRNHTKWENNQPNMHKTRNKAPNFQCKIIEGFERCHQLLSG